LCLFRRLRIQFPAALTTLFYVVFASESQTIGNFACPV
jgi:hypothetical protein